MLRRPLAGVKPPATAGDGLMRIGPVAKPPVIPAQAGVRASGLLTPTERRTYRAARRHTPVRLPAAKSTRRNLKLAAD